MTEGKNDYLTDFYQRQNRNQYLKEEKDTVDEIESIKKLIKQMSFITRLYFKDEHKHQLSQYDRPIFGQPPTLDRRLEAMNCAYESTVEYAKNPKFKFLRYIFKKPLR